MIVGILSPPSRTTCAYSAYFSRFSSIFSPRARQHHLNALCARRHSDER